MSYFEIIILQQNTKEIVEFQRDELKQTISLDDLDKRSTGRAGELTPLSQFQSMNAEDLLTTLKESKSLHEEADILHYLFETKYDPRIRVFKLKFSDLDKFNGSF